MKKISKLILTHDDLELFQALLEQGYPLLECLDILSSYHHEKTFIVLKKMLLEGTSFQKALTYFQVDTLWLEYFTFISQYTSLSEAMHGASALLKTKQQFIDICKKSLTYPLCLIVVMMFFALFTSILILPQMKALFASFNSQQHISIAYQMVLYLPYLMMLCVIGMILFVFDIYDCISKRNFQKLNKRLKNKYVGPILQYYYSLKFASYYAILSQYVPGLYDGISLMYEKMTNTDMMVIIYPMKQMLDMGNDFKTCIEKMPIFHHSFQKYCLLLLNMGKPLSFLEDYVSKTTLLLEKKIKKISKLFVSIIYVVTAIFIIVLYLMIMTPMMQIASDL